MDDPFSANPKTMKLLATLSFCLLGVLSLNAQDCDFYTPRFEVVEEDSIYFGSALSFDGSMDSLFLTIHKPKGNQEMDRPVIVWCFGGGFFAGERSSFNELSMEMASRGFVSATIDYRLGYVKAPFLGYPFAYDSNEIVRAGYRAMQDAKGAIRFLKNRASQDSSDIDRFFIAGGSAGAIASLAAAFIDQEGEVDTSVVGDLGLAMSTPPMERPALGSYEGDLNLGAYDASVIGVVNIFGAVFNTALLDGQSDMILYSYHQDKDPIVPCGRNKAYWGLPWIPENMPYGYGSCAIDDHLQANGHDLDKIKTTIHPGDAHAVHDIALIYDEMQAFLHYQLCGEIVANEDIPVSTFDIIPNPVGDVLQLEGELSDRVFIKNLFGQPVEMKTMKNGSVDVSMLKPGLYLISPFSEGPYQQMVKL